MLERIDRGALLVDDHGHVLDMNSCVELGDGLDISAGLLQATRVADRPRLQRYLAATVDPDRPPSTGPKTLALPRPSGRRPWVIDAIACGGALRSLHSRAAALILVTDIERPLRLNRNLLCAMFGLTSTEAGLAHEIVAGRSLQQAADHLDISVGHARQRLKAVFSKTGTARQVELVALLAKLV
jgi:DNA-binding CsgD family transcriptional regulator